MMQLRTGCGPILSSSPLSGQFSLLCKEPDGVSLAGSDAGACLYSQLRPPPQVPASHPCQAQPDPHPHRPQWDGGVMPTRAVGG